MIKIILTHFLIFFFVFIFSNCSTSEPYRLGELVGSLYKYENSILDPQVSHENKINKFLTGLKRYDDFFLSAKKLIIKIRFAIKLYYVIESDPEYLKKNPDIISLILIEISNASEDIINIRNKGEEISKTMKEDFKNNYTLLPIVISEVSFILSEISKINNDLKILSKLTNLNTKSDFKNNEINVTSSSRNIIYIDDYEERIKLLIEIEQRNKIYSELFKRKIK